MKKVHTRMCFVLPPGFSSLLDTQFEIISCAFTINHRPAIKREFVFGLGDVQVGPGAIEERALLK
jgi:hypothetical protein